MALIKGLSSPFCSCREIYGHSFAQCPNSRQWLQCPNHLRDGKPRSLDWIYHPWFRLLCLDTFMELNALNLPFPKFPSSCLWNDFSPLKFLISPLKFPIPPLKFLVLLLKFLVFIMKTWFSLSLQNILPSFVNLTWIFPWISQDPIGHLQQLSIGWMIHSFAKKHSWQHEPL